MKNKPRQLVGTTFTFRQYMCSHCRKMFFINQKVNLSIDEIFDEERKTYQSPCCKPFTRHKSKELVEPHGIYIRTLKLKVTEIPDEIALVAKRRYASEHGKPDPHKDKDEDEGEDET